LRLRCDGAIEIEQELALPGKNLDAARVAVTGQDSKRMQAHGPGEDARPVGEFASRACYAAVDGGIAGAEDAFFGQPEVAVRGRVSQPRKRKSTSRVESFRMNGDFRKVFCGRWTLSSCRSRTSARFASADCQRAGS